MSPLTAAFFFGFVAGYLMLRFGIKMELTIWGSKVLRPLGWLMMGASFVLAMALFAYGVLEGGSG